MIKDAPYGVSGAVGGQSEDTKLEDDFVCGVGREAFWAGNR